MRAEEAGTIEIERTFLVSGESWKHGARAIKIRQGYLAHMANGVVRVRTWGEQAFLAVKLQRSGLTRSEYEYEIPVRHAEAMLARCEGTLIEKTRYVIDYDGHSWEIDVFEGSNAGLVLAEIELQAEDEPFARPPWLGDEVSSDHRFKNSQLSRHPYHAATWNLERG